MSESLDSIIEDILPRDLVPIVLQYVDPNDRWHLVSKSIQLQWEKIYRRDTGKKSYLYRRLHSFDDQPIVKNNVSMWHKNGVYHRDNDLPAMIDHSKQKSFWYINGQLHRENDLPAIESPYLRKWYHRGNLHRNGDLPAVIINKNKTEYWKNGRLHRDGNLPAVIFNTGKTIYYVNGLLHRDDDLPAIEYFHQKEWFRNGVPCRENPMDPTKEFVGRKEWHDSNGNLHRDGDLPAFETDISSNGITRIQKWYQHGKLHRIGAPAVIFHYKHEYYENGHFIRSEGHVDRPLTPPIPEQQDPDWSSVFPLKCTVQ